MAEAIERDFVAYKINMIERHPDFKEACAGARVMWGPTFVIADARGSEVRRWVGWLPPRSFIAELAFSRALADHTHGKFAEALAGFDSIVERESGTEIHAEAMSFRVKSVSHQARKIVQALLVARVGNAGAINNICCQLLAFG